MKRNIMAVLLASALLAGIVPVVYHPDFAVHAEEITEAETKNYNDFAYQISDNQVIITGYAKSNLLYWNSTEYDYRYGEFEENVIIPEEIEGLPVTAVGDRAFLRSAFSTVQIPDSVERIGDGAFTGCGNLTEIQFPSALTSIGNSAFSGCLSLTEVRIPDSVTELGDSIFYNCQNLKKAVLPSQTEKIPDWTFSACYALEQPDFPENVKIIGHGAFERCWNLQNFDIPPSVVSIEDVAFAGCWKNLTEITIPETVTEFGGGAFGNCPNLKTVTLPENMTEIPSGMFEGIGIEKIIIPESVQNIDYFAFAICKNLEGITILNPDCEIAVPPSGMGITFSTGAYSETRKEYFKGIIYGYENSTAQEYAKQYGFKFEALDAPPLDVGDIDGSQNVDILDVITLNKAILGKEILSEREVSAIDFNKNGIPEAQEALALMKYIVGMTESLTA